MNDVIVTTLPLKPRENLKNFHYIIPVFVEQAGKLLNCKSNLMINNIGNYSDLNVEQFKLNMKKRELEFDSVLVDKENLPVLVDCVKKLIDDGKIVERKVQFYECDCGKVNILKEGIRKFDNGDLYTLDENEEVVCSLCKGKAKLQEKKMLVIENIGKYYEPKVCPLYMQKMMNDFVKQRNSCLLVSKTRDTGIKIKVNDQEYYLDIDFVWANFPQLFSEQNVIIFTASDLLYESFIVNLINNLHNTKNVVIVHQAKVLSNNKPFEALFNDFDNDRFKLNITFNINLKTYTTKWNELVYQFLVNRSDEDIKKLLKYPGYIIKTNEGEISPKDVENFFKYGFNFQFNKNKIG